MELMRKFTKSDADVEREENEGKVDEEEEVVSSDVEVEGNKKGKSTSV